MGKLGLPVKNEVKREEPKQSQLKQTKANKNHPYMLFMDGEQMPTAMHGTYKAAYREASRLFSIYPDAKILVLRHLMTFQKRNIEDNS